MILRLIELHFVEKPENGKEQSFDDEVSAEKEAELLHALLTYFSPNLQASSELTDDKGKCKTLTDYFSGAPQGLMKEKNLLLYFMQGSSYDHMDHFLMLFAARNIVLSMKLG